jgi:hypothetical protein
MSGFGAKVLTGSVLAMIGLVTVKVVVALISGALALLSFLLFTVLPVAVVGWLVWRAIRYLGRNGDKPAFE